MDDHGVAIEMPRYQSHKKVHALKIKDVGVNADTGLGWITPEEDGYATFEVDAAFMDKHEPKHGGYYVVYPDGYKSFSPAEAFESGYTRI